MNFSLLDVDVSWIYISFNDTAQTDVAVKIDKILHRLKIYTQVLYLKIPTKFWVRCKKMIVCKDFCKQT